MRLLAFCLMPNHFRLVRRIGRRERQKSWAWNRQCVLKADQGAVKVQGPFNVAGLVNPREMFLNERPIASPAKKKRMVWNSPRKVDSEPVLTTG